MKNSVNSLKLRRHDLVCNRGNQLQAKNLKLLSGLAQIVQYLLKVFVGSNELRIWQTYDRYGNNWWHAYDPVTGHHTSTDSEAELRAWVEQRYNTPQKR